MRPSVAARPLFFAARAWPRSLRTCRAPSTSPLDSSRARFTSIIPAAVSSRSCLIFSIVLANVPSSPWYSRSSLQAPLPRRAPVLSLRLPALPTRAPRRLPARPLLRRSPLPRALRQPRAPPRPPPPPPARLRPRSQRHLRPLRQLRARQRLQPLRPLQLLRRPRAPRQLQAPQRVQALRRLRAPLRSRHRGRLPALRWLPLPAPPRGLALPSPPRTVAPRFH